MYAKSVRVIVPLVLIALISAITGIGTATAQNLVVNGDFSQGNTGFSTTYQLAGNLFPPNVYMIIPNPSPHHQYGVDYGDHTTGNGLMMAVNGNDEMPVSEVWAETVAVQQNTQYTFSAWVSQWTSFFPCGAQLQFAVNENPIGEIFCVPDPAIWERHEVTWSSDGSTTARLAILNHRLPQGNDFAIDDISFTTTQAAPEPGSLALLLIGLCLLLKSIVDDTKRSIRIEENTMHRIAINARLLLLVLFFLGAVGVRFAFAQGTNYDIKPLLPTMTTDGLDHKWPSINNQGDVVWCQQENGLWRVYKLPFGATQAAPVTDNTTDYRYPSISDNGIIVYAKYGVGGGVGIQVIRDPDGGVIEFSSRNMLTGDHRDAGEHTGISSGDNIISYYTFVRLGQGSTRRFKTTKQGQFADNFFGYDYPDINKDGDIVYSGFGLIYQGTESIPLTDNTIANGDRPRVADRVNGTEPEVVYISGGQVVSTKNGVVDTGLTADVNTAGTVVFEKRDINGRGQIFLAKSTQPTQQAKISVSPSSLYFGNGIRDRRFAIKNIGDSGFVLTGNIVSPSAPFRILTGGGAFSLNSGQTRWVIVSMRPGGPGTYSGKITITSNDSQNSPINVPLSGINDDFVLLQSEPPGGEAQNSPPPADHVIAWGSDEFLRLVRNDNSSIVFAWPRPAFPFEDRYMTPLLAEKVDKLASMVMAEWQGLKLRITAGYDSTGMRHTGKNSTHYEARGVDITVSDRDIRKLGRLARLAKNAGFGWVYYEDALHVHASVSR